MSPSPVKEEPEEQLEEEWTPVICTRDEFLERLARDLELRNGRESGRNDGYSIIVKAVVERRDGNAARAEFVETEGPRLAHLVDPTGGRFLDWFDHGYNKEFIPMAEDPGRKHRPGRGIIQNVPGNIPQHRADAGPPGPRPGERVAPDIPHGRSRLSQRDFEETREWIKREHRSDLTQLMEEQEVAGA